MSLECLDTFANVLGIGTLKGPYVKATAEIQRKPQWVFYAYGDEAREIYRLLNPWLGSYRREQASKAFGSTLNDPLPGDFRDLPVAQRLAWAGGFFDGEGCFAWITETMTGRITNTDLELLQRFEGTVGFGKIYGPYAPHRTSFGKKRQYVYSTTGFERTQALLTILWPNVGSAKRTKAMSILRDHLTYWKCGHRRGPSWKMHCPDCFKPGPKPGSRQAKRSDTSLPGL